MAPRIGERDVGAAGAGELGVELDAVADIDDEQQRRAAFAGGQGAGVLLGLAAGASMASSHAALPRWAVPFFAALAFGLVALGERLGGFAFLDALLGFEDEAAALVEVDAAGAGGAVAVMKGDAALEDVGVVGVVGRGRVGPRNAEQIAELGEEELVVGTLRRRRTRTSGR